MFAYAGKLVDFLLPIRITYVSHFLKKISFYAQTTRQNNILLKLLGYNCNPLYNKNGIGIDQISKKYSFSGHTNYYLYVTIVSNIGSFCIGLECCSPFLCSAFSFVIFIIIVFVDKIIPTYLNGSRIFHK